MRNQFMISMAALALSGCATWDADQQATQHPGRLATSPAHAQTAPGSTFEAELRAKLASLRENPDQASPDLIAEIQLLLNDLEARKQTNRPQSTVAMTPAGQATAAPTAPSKMPGNAKAQAPVIKSTKARTGKAAQAKATPAQQPESSQVSNTSRQQPRPDLNMSTDLLSNPANAPASGMSPATHAEPRELEAIYASAMDAERSSQMSRAVALYREASARGHGPSTKRLMEIYTEGAPGVTKNYVAAVKLKGLAIRQGTVLEYAMRR